MKSKWAGCISVRVNYADALVARGIAAVLGQEPDLRVTLDGGPDAGVDDVLITDFATAMTHPHQPRHNRSQGDAPRVLIYSASRREHEVRQALEAAIPGFLSQGFALDELARAVRLLHRGGRYYDLVAAQQIALSLSAEPLTGREREVLNLLASGECNKTIARQLDVTLGTVKAHVGAILAKLGVDSRTQATRVAIQRGLVDSPWENVGWPARPNTDSLLAPQRERATADSSASN